MTEYLEAAPFLGQWKWLDAVFILAFVLAWMAFRRKVRATPPAREWPPVWCALALAAPWLAGHLRANGVNYFFPPSAGVDWLIFGSLLWPVALAACGLAAKGKTEEDPALWKKRRDRLMTWTTLALAGALFYLCQARAPWVFRPDESPADRAWTAAAVTAGGLLLCAGQGWLARLLPAAGFWLAQLAFTVTLALAARLSGGPAWLESLGMLPPVISFAWLLVTATHRSGVLPAITGVWCGALAGVPFLWSAISRTEAAEPLALLWPALLPPACAAALAALKSRLHPAGLSLTAAALILAGGSLILKRHASAAPEAAPLPPAATGADDSGAYD